MQARLDRFAPLDPFAATTGPPQPGAPVPRPAGSGRVLQPLRDPPMVPVRMPTPPSIPRPAGSSGSLRPLPTRAAPPGPPVMGASRKALPGISSMETTAA